MSGGRKRLVPDETALAVVQAYVDGDKVQDIATRFGIPRSTVYWLLERSDHAPNRTKRKTRLESDANPAMLYALILEQEEYIASLEEEVTLLRTRLKGMRTVSKQQR